MLKFEPVCQAERPDWLVVVGDVNSTVACTLVASKLGIKVAHVEAGLRSFDRTMPEELNRLVTDCLADLLLTPSEDANENLKREGIPESKIRLVGNIMIDALMENIGTARKSRILDVVGVKPGKFGYVTLHRPANVDNEPNLRRIAAELEHLSHRMPIVFPVHPRTSKMLRDFSIALNSTGAVRLVEPLGYHDSLCLCESARVVLTDSGGLQEEATFFRTPCLTLRPNTERPITIQIGSNRLTSVEKLREDIEELLARDARLGEVPPLWDGKTASRIVTALLSS
jgi:UDP-N-acetylglucosamine 2-epimerase (non-hydrolysing)